MPPMTKRQAEEAASELRHQRTTRDPMLADTDINIILMNGAQIALSKMKRSGSIEDQLYHYAQIGAYLEVSLSRGAGITDDTRDDLNEMHRKATHIYMQASRSN